MTFKLEGRVIGIDVEDGGRPRVKLQAKDGNQYCSWFWLYTDKLAIGQTVEITVEST